MKWLACKASHWPLATLELATFPHWQHFPPPKKLFRAHPCAALWDLVHRLHAPHRVNLLRRVILSVRILFFRGFDDMPSKSKLPLPNGYTRKFETEDVLVRKLVSRGLDAPNEDVLRNVLRIVGYCRASVTLCLCASVLKLKSTPFPIPHSPFPILCALCVLCG